MFELATPLRALAVALGGVGLAWLWFHEHWWLALLAGLAGCFVGWSLDWIGFQMLPKRPVAAGRLMEWWIVTPAVIAALASGAVAVVTVALAVPDSAKSDTKTLIGALTTGLTGFITTAFVSWSGDDKDSKLADHISSAFEKKYKREPGPDAQRSRHVHYFAADSDGERWVYSPEFKGVDGWGRPARIKRAKGIAEELRKEG